MKPVELQHRLEQLFARDHRAEAEALLERECGAGRRASRERACAGIACLH